MPQPMDQLLLRLEMGAFLGADVIDGFLEVGAGLTGTVDAALDDAGWRCWMEDAATDACGTGGGAACCICPVHAGWTLLNLMSSSVMPEIQVWTLSCSSMM